LDSGHRSESLTLTRHGPDPRPCPNTVCCQSRPCGAAPVAGCLNRWVWWLQEKKTNEAKAKVMQIKLKPKKFYEDQQEDEDLALRSGVHDHTGDDDGPFADRDDEPAVKEEIAKAGSVVFKRKLEEGEDAKKPAPKKRNFRKKTADDD